MGNRKGARCQSGKSPLLNLEEWQVVESEHMGWLMWSTSYVEQVWGITDQLPEGLGGVRAGAAGSTATYRIMNRRDGSARDAPIIPIPLNVLNYCSTQRVATMAKGEPLK